MINNFVVFLEGASSAENEAIRQRVIDIKFTKGRSRLSGIFVGFGNIICDNSDGYFDSFEFSPYRKIEVATYHQYVEGSPPMPFRYYFIRGYEKAFKKNEVEKTIEFVFEDRLTFLNKKKCANKTYKNETVYTIIRELVYSATGGLYPFVYTNSETIPFLSINDSMTVQEALQIVLEAVGGFIITEETEIFAYTGFYSPITTQNITIDENEILSFSVYEKEGAYYDKSTLKIEEYTFKDNVEKVYEGVRTENILVPSGGLGVSEEYYLELDDPIHYLGAPSTVEFEADTGLTFDTTTYNSNLQTGNVPVNSNRVKIKVTNSTGTTKEIKKLNLFGKKYYTKKVDAIYQPTGSDANELVFENTLVQDRTQAGKIAALNLARENFEETYVIQTELFRYDSSEFDFWKTIVLQNLGRRYAFKLGSYDFSEANDNLLTPIEISFDFANNVLEAKFRKSHYLYNDYSSSNVSFKEYLGQGKGEISGDGEPPSPPSNLVLNSSQPSGEYKSVLNVSFDASSSSDVKIYNIEHKKAEERWDEAKKKQTKNLSAVLEVEENILYNVRVNAEDVEGLTSTYISGNILSNKIVGDGSPPPAFGFVDSSCAIEIINNKRYAHLVFKRTGSATDDIKEIVIKYRKTEDDFEFGVDYDSRNIYIAQPAGNEKRYAPTVTEAYIEIERAKYTFAIFSEDFEGNVTTNNLNTTNDGIIYLDGSSSYVFSSSTPAAPSTSTPIAMLIDGIIHTVYFEIDTPNFDHLKRIEFQIQEEDITNETVKMITEDIVPITKSKKYKVACMLKWMVRNFSPEGYFSITPKTWGIVNSSYSTSSSSSNLVFDPWDGTLEDVEVSTSTTTSTTTTSLTLSKMVFKKSQGTTVDFATRARVVSKDDVYSAWSAVKKVTISIPTFSA